MATQRHEHPFERVVNRVVETVETTSDQEAANILDKSGGRPPWTVKLSEDEQLEVYFMMDEAKWAELIESMGPHEVKRYSLAMQRLVRKKYGDEGGFLAVFPPEPSGENQLLAAQGSGMPVGPEPASPQPAMPSGPPASPDPLAALPNQAQMNQPGFDAEQVSANLARKMMGRMNG